MSSKKETTTIKISRKKESNSTKKKSHKNLNYEKDNGAEIIKFDHYISPPNIEEDEEEHNNFENEKNIDVKLIKYGEEYYLLSSKDLVYTVPTDLWTTIIMYNENIVDYSELFKMKRDNFKLEESNVYLFVGKKKKDKIIFDAEFLKLKQLMKANQHKNIELLQDNLKVNSRILYLPENREGFIIDNSNDKENIKIMIDNKIMQVDIKNIELI